MRPRGEIESRVNGTLENSENLEKFDLDLNVGKLDIDLNLENFIYIKILIWQNRSRSRSKLGKIRLGSKVRKIRS